jgi:hypothetical protein
MKRLLFTILIMFMVTRTAVNAADFVLTLPDYRAQIKRRLNIDISNSVWMTDSVMNQLIREAIVTVLPTIEGVQTTKRFTTTPERMAYPIDSTVVSVYNVGWKAQDTVRWFQRIPMSRWSMLTNQNTYGGDDPYLERPAVYDLSDDSIFLFPIPTMSDDTILYMGTQKITNIATRDTINAIPQDKRIPILNYATYLVAVAKQHHMMDTYKIMADSAIMGSR